MSVPVPEKPTVDEVLGWLRKRDEEVAYLQNALDGVKRAEEKQRQRDHHEVLCRVIDKLLEAQLRCNTTNGDLLDKLVGVHMEISRAYADLAYPPPKAEWSNIESEAARKAKADGT